MSRPRSVGLGPSLLTAFLIASCGAPRADAPRAQAVGAEPVPPAPTTPVSVPPEVIAQPSVPASASIYSRGDCLRLALASNRPFLNKRSALQRARLGQTIAESTVYVPRLDASYTMTNSDDVGSGKVGVVAPALGFSFEPFVTAGYAQNGDTLTTRDSWTTAYGITISRRLFSIHEHLRQRLPITLAEKDFYVAANHLAVEGKKLELETSRGFFAVQRTQSHLAVRARRVDDARAFLDATKDQVAHGFQAPVDEILASISLNQAEADLLDERTAMQNAKDHLMRLLAMPIGASVEIAEEDLAKAEYPLPELDRDVARAKTDAEELSNQAAEIQVQIDQLRIQRDLLWPQLTAAFTAEKQKTGDRMFDDRVRDENIYFLTLSYQLPLDLNRAARARYQQIKDEIAEKTLALREAEAALEEQLRATHRRIAQLQGTVRLAGLRLDAERGKMDAMMVRYNAGGVDSLEVTRAKQDLDNAEIALLDSRINLVLAVSEYRAQMPAATRAGP
jgi:outer membrane protein TolC